MLKVRTVLASLAVGASGIYFYHLQPFLYSLPSSPLHSSKILVKYDIPEHLLLSKTLAIVNRKQYAGLRDTRRMTVRIPKGTSDEEILARFTKGFFGGWAFAPESVFFNILRWDLVNYPALDGVSSSTQIWSQGSISSTSLPPLQATLFGGFRLVNRTVQSSNATAPNSPFASITTSNPAARTEGSPSHSYVDYVFGSETGLVAGVHRFSVFRERDSLVEGNEDYVTVEMASAAHSPKADAYLQARPMSSLHFWYAKALFREGIVGVMQAGK